MPQREDTAIDAGPTGENLNCPYPKLLQDQI